MSGSLLQQLPLTFELFPLFIFFLHFLTILFYNSFELSLWAVWRPDSRFSFWSQYLFFQDFPPCPGSLYAALLFTVGISCWPSVALQWRRMSGLMSPHKLRRKTRRGCRSGAVRCSRRTRNRPVLLSVIMGNVLSLPNKMDKLTVLTQHQRDYCECSIMLLTETWLTELTPDTDANLDGFQLRRADRMAESSKRKGGGLTVFVYSTALSVSVSVL